MLGVDEQPDDFALEARLGTAHEHVLQVGELPAVQLRVLVELQQQVFEPAFAVHVFDGFLTFGVQALAVELFAGLVYVDFCGQQSYFFDR